MIFSHWCHDIFNKQSSSYMRVLLNIIIYTAVVGTHTLYHHAMTPLYIPILMKSYRSYNFGLHNINYDIYNITLYT